MFSLSLTVRETWALFSVGKLPSVTNCTRIRNYKLERKLITRNSSNTTKWSLMLYMPHNLQHRCVYVWWNYYMTRKGKQSESLQIFISVVKYSQKILISKVCIWLPNPETTVSTLNQNAFGWVCILFSAPITAYLTSASLQLYKVT